MEELEGLDIFDATAGIEIVSATDDEEKIPFAQLWAGQRAVILLLRRFG